MAFAADGAKVHEDIVAGIAGDEAKALGGIEPLDRTGLAVALGAAAFTGAVGKTVALAGFAAEVVGNVQQRGNSGAQQAEQDHRLAGQGAERGEDAQALQCHGGNQQGRAEALQQLAIALPMRQLRCQQQVEQAQQGQVDGVGLLQIRNRFGAQGGNKGQQQGGNARQQMDDFQH